MRVFRLAAEAAVVCLLVGLSCGCKPQASFTASTDEGSAPLAVTFTDTSATVIPFLGNANAYIPFNSRLWDFGDGVVSEQQNPQHTYRNQGIYTVSLTVGTRFGTDTETKNDTIKVTGNAASVKANFTATPITGVAPLTVTFTEARDVGTATINAFEWNFGDDTTGTQENPTHTYTEPGTYSVTLTIRTTLGTSTITKQNLIEVVEEPRGPQAAFKENRTQGTAPLTVAFTDLSTPGDAAITRWDWDFGDSGTSTSQNPTHIYETPGTYPVTLTVTTSLGTSTRRKADLIRVIAAAR